jgi:AraC family transcriptional regulator
MHIPEPASPVYEVLSRSHADLEREALLGDGLRSALWLREQLEDTLYDRPLHHTLSLYLEDGRDVYLDGEPERRGAPGKLCLLPAGHASRWRINGRIRFVHVYFSPQTFGQLAVRMLDCEPRMLELRQRIYIDDPALAALTGQLARLDWSDNHDRLEANALGHEIMARLLLEHTTRPTGIRVRGGLAPLQRHRALDLIEARLAEPLSVGELAAELALSEYHFARMFRTSVGEAPHQWILRRRLARARELLATGTWPLDLIATAAGFSHASHLTRHFRAASGVTPHAYRQWVQGRARAAYCQDTPCTVSEMKSSRSC